MKTEIHPEYKEAQVHCSCGEVFTTRSTTPKINVEICSKCHPFYTGKQKFVDTGGRVERFQKKYETARKQVEAKAKQQPPKEEASPEVSETPEAVSEENSEETPKS